VFGINGYTGGGLNRRSLSHCGWEGKGKHKGICTPPRKGAAYPRETPGTTSVSLCEQEGGEKRKRAEETLDGPTFQGGGRKSGFLPPPLEKKENASRGKEEKRGENCKRAVRTVGAGKPLFLHWVAHFHSHPRQDKKGREDKATVSSLPLCLEKKLLRKKKRKPIHLRIKSPP